MIGEGVVGIAIVAEVPHVQSASHALCPWLLNGPSQATKEVKLKKHELLPRKWTVQLLSLSIAKTHSRITTHYKAHDNVSRLTAPEYAGLIVHLPSSLHTARACLGRLR